MNNHPKDTKAMTAVERLHIAINDGIHWLQRGDAERAETELRAALRPTAPTPAPVELSGIEDGDGYWQPCSGCYETSDGQNVHGYPFSSIFGCIRGGGCFECGGIGVVWTQITMAAPTPADQGVVELAERLREDARAVEGAYYSSPRTAANLRQAADTILSLRNVLTLLLATEDDDADGMEDVRKDARALLNQHKETSDVSR